MERFSLEVKVGLVVVLAAGLVLAFIFILGDWNPFTNTYKITMTLKYAGGIKPGSDVQLAGAKVGKVDAIRYLPINDQVKDAPIVGLELLIDKRAQNLIRDDSAFAVRMESLLGGKMVEITPGSAGAKALADKAEVRGQDPPRLEDLINEAVSMIEELKGFLDSLTPEDRARMRQFLATLSRFGPEDVDEVRRALKNTADATGELKVIAEEVRPQIQPILLDVRTALAEVEPTLNEARGLVRKLDRTVTELRAMAPKDPDAARAKVDELLNTADDLKVIMDRLDRFTARMETELKDVDRRELERIMRQFFQQEGVTINVKKVLSDPKYPLPPPEKQPTSQP
jgi:phospholipid/cholesterol/gamma-HCH transport system substrate-binding protein